jgi:tRNA(fMet)-specific endonuclease VapC
MITYALDSNIISFLLKNKTNIKQRFDNAIESNIPYSIPPLAYYEVKRWLIARNATVQLNYFDDLYNYSIKSDMTIAIWEKAIDIYVRLKQVNQLIDDADVFIAAYCIVNGYVLITDNTKHFYRISELTIINWNNNNG